MYEFLQFLESLADLRTAKVQELRDAAEEALAEIATKSDDQLEELGVEKVAEVIAFRDAAGAELAEREASETAAADAREAAKAALETEEAEEEAEEEEPSEEEDADAEASAEVEEAEVEETEEAEVEEAPAKVPAAAGDLQAELEDVEPNGRLESQQGFIAGPNIRGIKEGHEFADFVDLAGALDQRWQDIQGAKPGEIYPVASLEGKFDDDRIIPDNGVAWFVDEPEALTAAGCAPNTPFYNLGCQSSNVRPVINSMRRFRAPRGGVSIPQPPRLADIEGGYGQWTFDDNFDVGPPSARKVACQTINCTSYCDYEWYGMYSCLSVKNMNHSVFPELTAAYLNRLAAVQASFAETTLLDRMMAGQGVIDLGSVESSPADTSLSLAAKILAGLNRAVTGYREDERYVDQAFDVWMHLTTRAALVEDRIKMGDLSGSLAEFDRGVAALGIRINWTREHPTHFVSASNDIPTNGWIGVPAATTYIDFDTGAGGDTIDDGIIGPDELAAGLLLVPPCGADCSTGPVASTDGLADWLPEHWFLATPRGNFAVLDSGRVDIGVLPGNRVPSEDDVFENQFTLFFETFEGVMDFGCRSLYGTITGCPSGSFVDAHAPIACPAPT